MSLAATQMPDREFVFIVFSHGDLLPISACATEELAEKYAEALGKLPSNHPLHTKNACVDKVPLNRELPEPLRDPISQAWYG